MIRRRIQLCFIAAFIAFVFAVVLMPDPATGAISNSTIDGFKKILETRSKLLPGHSRVHTLRGLEASKVYSLAFSLPSPESLRSKDRIGLTLRDSDRVIATKVLHVGDPDVYLLFKDATGSATIEISPTIGASVDYSALALEWPSSTSESATLEAEPNDSWRHANEIALGKTVWAGTDDKAYVRAEASGGRVPYQQASGIQTQQTQSGLHASSDRLPEGGIDWFRFTCDNDTPQLVYFEVELLERDNIPVDVSIYQLVDGEAKLYERGADPVSPPHEVQALPGNKFTTRTLTRGTYFVRVDANHPFYQLKTSVYEAPPYADARRAVRAGADYLLSAGDSWHANTPRHGGIVDRVSSVHTETSTCIACHATHFTTRGALIAKQNGYPVFKRPQLQFLTERLYNNPRPFYGHPEATWARVISAAANVSSRLASLLNLYENEVSGERRVELLKGVGGYLKLYYKDRVTLPKDESNGNTPLVSTYEVAFYSWRVFDELSRQAHDAESAAYRDRVRKLLEEDQHKNVVDLCYQTIALATIDRDAYSGKIRRNAERLLELQRPDGQWSMLLEPGSPAVEFQTGHCLYTLGLAGYSKDDPRIEKGLRLLLARQQDFGGWFDPKQSYENFRTPFRETQFAVMALSQFYPGQVRDRGWNDGAIKFSSSTAGGTPRLAQMDSLWDKRDAQTINSLTKELTSSEAMVRTGAAAALGRIGDINSLPALVIALGDSQKQVQLASSQAMRRIVERERRGYEAIERALRSTSGRTRWGAVRIFAQHFSALADRRDLADRLIALQQSDPLVTVRMQASKSLTQWFYWTKDESLKDRIADSFVSRMSVTEHPWIRRSLLEGFYSLADENVRYLYDNWIALIATADDRERAVRGHHEASRKMAERISRALLTGNDLQREGLLEGLTAFHLRTGGYANGGRYTRIGNDTETIRFYQEGAPLIEKALIPALKSPDAKRRRDAILAANTVRDAELLQLPLLVMESLIDKDQSVRAVAEEFYRSLPLKVVESNRQQAVAALRKLLTSSSDEAKIAALDRVGTLGSDVASRQSFASDIKALVAAGDFKVAPAAIRALSGFPDLVKDPALQERIAASLNSDGELQRAGLQLTLKHNELRSLRPIAAALDTLFSSRDSARRRMVLGLITKDSGLDGDLRVLNLLIDSLRDKDEQVRAAALGALRRVGSFASNEAIRAELVTLSKDPSQRIQGQAIALYQGQDAASVAIDGRDTSRTLDYQFFIKRVMPLLVTKGADGNACVNCHSSHAIFRLSEPGTTGYSTEALRDNFNSALKVVDTTNPEASLILRKPTTNADQEGVVGSKKLSHGGGQRWAGAEDPAYKTLLDWINGARLEKE